MKKIILASGSPRRKEIMEQVGLSIEIMASTKEETITRKVPAEVVMELAGQKAEDVAAQVHEDAVIIGADTIVVQDGAILGKPRSMADAVFMLQRLSGKTHAVYTGVCIISKKHNHTVKQKTFYEVTDVTMYPLSDQDIIEYVETGEPMDKAGAYGIQGRAAAFLKKIEGDYYNVVGLPIGRVVQELKSI